MWDGSKVCLKLKLNVAQFVFQGEANLPCAATVRVKFCVGDIGILSV